jgi:hypothetical protein
MLPPAPPAEGSPRSGGNGREIDGYFDNLDAEEGEQVELDVSFQSGNVISLIISSKDEALIENMKVGVKLEDVHFYSPVAIFRGSGIVSAMTQIKSGPKKGDYSLDIKIESL